ncbi:MAG TPA: hypothetical protein VLG44_05970 [Chlamydiales bacterium]|nr:hypothetical protein [Chlamydiales bacterium]
MSSLTVITSLPKDIYAQDTLAEAMRNPLKELIARVDLDNETIQSFFTQIHFSGYQKTHIPNRFDKRNGEYSCKFRPKIVKVEWLDAIENSLKLCWESMVSNYPKRNLVILEGDIDVTVYTIMEKVSGALLTHTFQKKFYIEQLEYPLDLSDLPSYQLKRVQSELDLLVGKVMQLKREFEDVDGLLDFYQKTANKLKAHSLLV